MSIYPHLQKPNDIPKFSMGQRLFLGLGGDPDQPIHPPPPPPGGEGGVAWGDNFGGQFWGAKKIGLRAENRGNPDSDALSPTPTPGGDLEPRPIPQSTILKKISAWGVFCHNNQQPTQPWRGQSIRLDVCRQGGNRGPGRAGGKGGQSNAPLMGPGAFLRSSRMWSGRGMVMGDGRRMRRPCSVQHEVRGWTEMPTVCP